MSSEATPLVGIIMGSKSDMPAMEACTEQLDAFGVPYELVIASAHRAPAKVHEWASTAADRGIKVIIAAAGKAAHLGGVVAVLDGGEIFEVPGHGGSFRLRLRYAFAISSFMAMILSRYSGSVAPRIWVA